MERRHWHLAVVEGRGSAVMAEAYPDWPAAVAAKRQLETAGGVVLTVRQCAGKCPAAAGRGELLPAGGGS